MAAMTCLPSAIISMSFSSASHAVCSMKPVKPANQLSHQARTSGSDGSWLMRRPISKVYSCPAVHFSLRYSK